MSCPHRNPEPPYSDITLTLSTNATLTIITIRSAHLSCSFDNLCISEWVVNTEGQLCVYSAFIRHISENEMAANKTEALWSPAGVQQEQGQGVCGPRSVFSVFLSYYLFSMTPGECKQFFGSTAILMTFTGARALGQQTAGFGILTCWHEHLVLNPSLLLNLNYPLLIPNS